MAASVAFGVRDVNLVDIVHALGGSNATASEAAVSVRIPRTVLAALIGGGLALSGVTMQAVTRNPLADPGIFGVLAGAAFFVASGIAFFDLSGQLPTIVVAIIGSAVAAVFVYSVGSIGYGGATPLKLALAGAATTAALSAMVSAVLLPRSDVMDQFRFWQIGSVGGANWTDIAVGTPVFLVGVFICLGCATRMNSLALGDDIAAALGIHVVRARLIASLGAVIVCGVATALAGPIGFVGLIVPHLCRLLVGTDHRWLLPYSAMCGAVLLVSADTLGRVIAKPSEISVGILLPLMGAPLFIWIVRRYRTQGS
ncbi:MAG: iron ABC transporter permease [Corynebacterium sp.]|uniref:FecCD family ABC transporter permease n=1 Tax=Corynebacterium sp. TaxID=1720 RepID=UPI0026DC3894|nr:iron ABC transporter permease [Corynebacterium sp.]MDO5099530.1 iron ABC transporter permease [Corynebacterium sp.]